MKEAIHSPYNKLVFRETFNSEQETRKRGTPTDVTFANGKGTFNGTSSKVNYNLGLNGTYSVRVRCNPTSFSDYRSLLTLQTGYVYLNLTDGTVQKSSGKVYVNGVASSSTTVGIENEVVVTGIELIEATASNKTLIGSNLGDDNEFLGTIDLVEIYSGTLTPSEVSNLYNDRWNTELPPTTPREVTQFSCDTTVSGWQRCADDSGTNTGGTYGVGKSLKKVGIGSGVGAGNDLVGFAATLPGYRATNASFYGLGAYLDLWSSTPSSATNAWSRDLATSYSTVHRAAVNKALGFSVRCLRDTDDTSDFTDPRDGTVYQCVRIGTQVWMTKNLAYLPSVNEVADNSTDDPMYYVYGYDGTDVATAKALSNYTEYGVLYNHPAAIISAPTGFHVPSDEELNVLEVFVVKMIKLLNPNNTLIDFDSTNGVLELGDLNETSTATDVTVNKNGALFNGTTSQISVGTDPVLTKAITGMHIFKPLDLSSDMCYYSNGKYQFIVLANGGIEVQRDGSTSALSATGIIKSNGTYGIAYTSEADGTTNIYFTDLSTGLVISGSADQSAGTPANGTTDLILGANVGARYNGYIMKDKIIEGVLSLAEMTRFFTSNSRGIR